MLHSLPLHICRLPPALRPHQWGRRLKEPLVRTGWRWLANAGITEKGRGAMSQRWVISSPSPAIASASSPNSIPLPRHSPFRTASPPLPPPAVAAAPVTPPPNATPGAPAGMVDSSGEFKPLFEDAWAHFSNESCSLSSLRCAPRKECTQIQAPVLLSHNSGGYVSLSSYWLPFLCSHELMTRAPHRQSLRNEVGGNYLHPYFINPTTISIKL